MTTLQDWVHETRRHLLGSDREQHNRLDTAIASTSSTDVVYEFSTFGGIREGALIEIDQELMFVWSVNTGTRTATVQRGFNGTTAATHSENAIITVNPRFPTMHIVAALNQELIDLCSPTYGLFRVTVEEIPFVAGQLGYDLSLTDFLGGIELHVESDTQTKRWRRVDHWRIIENADTGDFASGRALMLGEETEYTTGNLRLTYKQSFDALSSLTDDVNTVSGLPVECNDIPPIGAAARLAFPRGIKRSFDEAQGEPRRASEVEAMAMVQNASALMGYRNRRITAEATRLSMRYPTRLVR